MSLAHSFHMRWARPIDYARKGQVLVLGGVAQAPTSVAAPEATPSPSASAH
ncbi:MAG: hypothetical protein QM756_20075 [Polyangiaceae bacterium]